MKIVQTYSKTMIIYKVAGPNMCRQLDVFPFPELRILMVIAEHARALSSTGRALSEGVLDWTY